MLLQTSVVMRSSCLMQAALLRQAGAAGMATLASFSVGATRPTHIFGQQQQQQAGGGAGGAARHPPQQQRRAPPHRGGGERSHRHQQHVQHLQQLQRLQEQQQQTETQAPHGGCAFAAAAAPNPAATATPSAAASARLEVARCASRLAVPLAPGTPSTFAGALAPSATQARVITEVAPPFRVVRVNAAWEQLCGWRAADVEGRTMALVQCADTDRAALRAVRDAALSGARARVTVVNRRRDGSRFVNAVTVSPLYDGAGAVSHLLGVVDAVAELGGGGGDSGAAAGAEDGEGGAGDGEPAGPAPGQDGGSRG